MLLCGFFIHRIEQSDDFNEAPYMRRDTRFHRWRHAEGLMHAAEVVVHEVKRHGRFVWECVGLQG